MKKILVVFIFLMSFFSLFAQEKREDLTLKFETDSIIAKKTKIIQTSLYIKNNSDKLISGELEINSANTNIHFIKKIKQNIKLQPNDFIYIPVKAQLKPKTTSSEILVNAVLKVEDKTYRQELIVIPEKIRSIQIETQNQNLTFFKINDTLNFDFKILNNGNTDQQINLVLKYPNGLTKEEFETVPLDLKAHQDTLLHLHNVINKSMFKKEDFEINVSLYYKNGDYINSFPIYVSSIKQSRVYRDPNIDDYRYQENELRISNSYNSSSKQNNLNLKLNSNIKLSNKERLHVNTQMEYWDNSDLFFLRNTSIGYHNRKFDANIGNLYQQGEIMINGIGAEVKYKFTDSLNVEVGYIDKTYSVMEPFKNSSGYSGWAALNTIKNNKARTRTFFNYDFDYNSKINKYILYHSQEFVASKKLKLVYQQGLSTMYDKDKVATGILVGISNLYTSENWSYYGSQVASSNSYAGMRRGVLQLNERIQYKFKNHSFSTNYNYNKLNPEGFNRYELFFNNQTNQNINLGYRYSHKIYSFFLSSNYINEKRTSSYYSDISHFKKIGLNTTFQINNFIKNYSINTAVDVGKILTFNLITPYSYRLYLGIKYKKFNISSQYQYNYTSINELNNPDQLKKTYKSLSSTLMYNVSGFKNKLEFSTFINYSLNNNLADIIVLNSTLNYELNRNFRLFVNTNYNKYLDGLKYSNLNIQGGIIKNFNPNKIKVEKVNLTVNVKYNEKNQNAFVAQNKIVFINNKPFITDENGKIKYKKIPVGTYEIRLQNDNEWLSEPIIITIDTDTEQDIFFNKTTTISGNLMFEEGKSPYEIVKDKGAFKIELISSNGKTYKTYTDDNGRYTIYLPEGTYTIKLNNHLPNTQTEVKVNDLEITTEIGKPIHQDFTIKIKDKKTEVKKFNSVKF